MLLLLFIEFSEFSEISEFSGFSLACAGAHGHYYNNLANVRIFSLLSIIFV